MGYLACMTHGILSAVGSKDVEKIVQGWQLTSSLGSAIVFPAESFDPIATVKAVRDEKCTALHGVPTMFIAELELLDTGVVDRDAFKYLRTGIAAGSSVPLELMKKLHQKLNLTELSKWFNH